MDKKSTLHTLLRNEANQQPIPQGMQWENMQEGVLSKVKELDKIGTPVTGISTITTVCLFVVGLLVAGVALYLKEDSTSGEVARKDVPSHLVQYNDHQIEFNTHTNPVEIDNDRISKESFLANSANQSKTTTKADKTSTIVSNQSSNVLEKASNTENNKEALIHQQGKANSNNVEPVELETQVLVSKPLASAKVNASPSTKATKLEVVPANKTITAANTERVSIEKNAENIAFKTQFGRSSNTQIMDEMMALNHHIQSIKNEREALTFSFEAKESSYDVKPKAISNWSIGLAAGATNWSPNFKGGELADEKNRSEVGIISYGSDFSINYHFNDRWSLSSGLQYLSRESRFDHYSERDSIVQLEVTELEVNLISGELFRQRTKVEDFTAVNWTQVIHFNEYRTLSIPLMLSRKFGLIGDVYLEIGAGVKYSIWSFSTGRTVEHDLDGEMIPVVQDFDDSLYTFSHQFAALGNMHLAYQATKRVSLGLGIQADYSLNNLSLNADYTFKPSTFYGYFKTGYSF